MNIFKLFSNQNLIISKLNTIMSALTDLQASLANEDTAIEGLVTAFNNVNNQLKNLPVDDSVALAALKADVDTQTQAINAALNPPAAAAPAAPAAGATGS